MTSDDVRQELEREPFVPLCLRLASGRRINIAHEGTAWVRKNTLLIVHPFRPGSAEIGNYDVIALPLIERMEQAPSGNGSRRRSGRRR
jgi:hypothetical protein